MQRERLDPDAFGAWQRIIRDFACTVLGIFMFVYGSLVVRELNILGAMFGAGLILLGLPQTIRLDRARDEDAR